MENNLKKAYERTFPDTPATKAKDKLLEIFEKLICKLKENSISVMDITSISIEAMDGYGDKIEFEII